MLFKLHSGNGYVAFPGDVNRDRADEIIRPGKKRKVRIGGLAAIGSIALLTFILLILNHQSVAPVASIGVLIFGLSLLKFYNETAELLGGLRQRRRLRRLEVAGELVWVPERLKLRTDKLCQLRKLPVPDDLFTYDMAASRTLVTLYRALKKPKQRQQSDPLREQIDALLNKRIAADDTSLSQAPANLDHEM